MKKMLYEEISKNEKWNDFKEKANEFEDSLPRVFDLIDDDVVLNISEIAQLLGKSEETVRRWCRDGKIRLFMPVGGYTILGADLKDFLYKWYRKDILNDLSGK